MINFTKNAFLIIVSLLAGSNLGWAEFRQALVDRAMKMASNDYQMDGNPVARAVQAANFLAHELTLEADLARAQDIADTLIALVGKGQGVGGISKTPANNDERPLLVNALEKAAHFLKELKLPNQDNFGLEKTQPHDQSHLGQVIQIMKNAYTASTTPKPVYNASLQQKIQQLDNAEKLADGNSVDYRAIINQKIAVAKQTKTDWPMIINILKTTVIPEKASYVAGEIFDNLKKIDFSKNPDDVYTDALIAVEKYRMFETRQGLLKTADPDMFTYQETTQSHKSQAVLLALVSAIQNYLYNPAATPEDLIQLFTYQINSQKIQHPAVRDAAKALIRNGQIQRFINQGLLNKIKNMSMNITDVQKLAIDAEAMKQSLMFYSVPHFNRETFQQINPSPQFLRYFGSSGSGLQCGFFSLGFQSREEAINQILDNLEEPEILAMVDGNFGGSSSIKRVMDNLERFTNKGDQIVQILVEERLQSKKRQLKESRAAALKIPERSRSPNQREKAALSDEAIDQQIEDEEPAVIAEMEDKKQEIIDEIWTYVGLYADNKGLEYEDEQSRNAALSAFRQEVGSLYRQCLQKDRQIDATFEQDKRDRGINGRIPEDRSTEVAIMQNEVRRQKSLHWSHLLRLVYSKDDLRREVHNSINGKFSGGELEFDPNPDWYLRVSTYPQILAQLNHYNIYAWVSKNQFSRMQRERGGFFAAPIHRTEDDEYVLTNYLEGSPRGKPIGLLNKNGGHFEKWIAADDYPRLARAVRHKKLYKNAGLTRDTAPPLVAAAPPRK